VERAKACIFIPCNTLLSLSFPLKESQEERMKNLAKELMLGVNLYLEGMKE